MILTERDSLLNLSSCVIRRDVGDINIFRILFCLLIVFGKGSIYKCMRRSKFNGRVWCFHSVSMIVKILNIFRNSIPIPCSSCEEETFIWLIDQITLTFSDVFFYFWTKLIRSLQQPLNFVEQNISNAQKRVCWCKKFLAKSHLSHNSWTFSSCQFSIFCSKWNLYSLAF